KPPLWIAAVLVGAFAIFHGHAHGAELPIGADAVAFSMGFVVATGTLHLGGITFGGLSHWPAGRVAVRAAGGVISLLGFAYLGKILCRGFSAPRSPPACSRRRRQYWLMRRSWASAVCSAASSTPYWSRNMG